MERLTADLDDSGTTAADDAPGSGDRGWIDVCEFNGLQPDRGVCALVGGEAVAVFRCWPDDALYAVGNVDPFSGASVLSRGIVGSADDTVFVASPIFKERFDLRTGEALDDPAIQIPTYEVQVVAGQVMVASRPRVLEAA